MTATSLGNGQYALNLALPFTLASGLSGQTFYVELTSTQTYYPRMSAGGIELDAAAKYQVFTWDSHNRLVQGRSICRLITAIRPRR